jgi:hypothetical protein
MPRAKTLKTKLKRPTKVKNLECDFTFIPGVTTLEDLGRWAEKVSKKIK